MSLSNTACCSLLPVVSDYTPKGYMTKISNIDAYVIGDNKERTLICIYDIFGYLIPYIYINRTNRTCL